MINHIFYCVNPATKNPANNAGFFVSENVLESFRSFLAPALSTINRGTCRRFEGKFCDFCSAFGTSPVSLNHFPRTEIISRPGLSFFRPTFFAEYRSVRRRLERHLGDFCSAFGTSPLAFDHFSVRGVLLFAKCHRFFFYYLIKKSDL